jgi:hypothetical protein
MLALGRILCLIACLGAAAPALAQEKAPPDKASELDLARELIAQREKLDRMKADPGAAKDAVLAQERRLMEVRARLSASLASELARQSVDGEQWGQAWQGMKDFLRDKLRGWLDDAPSAPPETTRT